MQITRDGKVDVLEIPKPLYLILRLRRLLEPFWVKLGDLESRLLRNRLREQRIEHPVYVTGLARAGTTITLELLSRHDDVATHRYFDMAQPYLPFAWNWLAEHAAKRPSKPQERLHADGIFVTRESPEAVEETLWQWFFPHLHEESRSAVLDADTRNRPFEIYYNAHITKLLLARRRTRYLTKANYNVTRLAYLLRLFPGARVLVIVRRPVAHFASWLKQHELLFLAQTQDPRWLVFTDSVGHYEFGVHQRFANTGDLARAREIRSAWDSGERARAFGLYWASVYGHVLDLAARDPLVREAIMFVRYEDLCASPPATIDRMLEHAKLDGAGFKSVREQFAAKLSAPRYYRASLDDAELHAIEETTHEVAARLGY